jgi:outer membrane protein assembly factor BamB
MNHLVCIAIIILMTLSSLAMAGEWRSHFADPANTGRAQTAGPDTPGLKWNIELQDVETSFAPNGYGTGTNSQLRRPLVAPDGTLIVAAKNNSPQYENRLTEGREVIGIDPADGSVIWEIPHASTDHQRCRPALDSQGRLWVHQSRERYDVGGPWSLKAFDPATGEEISGTRFVTSWSAQDFYLSTCRRTSLHIGGEGAHERLVMYGNGGDPGDLLVLDISGTEPEVVIAGISGPESIAGVPGGGSFTPRIGVFSDDSLIIAIEATSGHLVLLQIPLDASEPPLQKELPTPDGSSAVDYSRVEKVVADNGSLIVSGRGDGDGFVAALDLDDELSTLWFREMPNGHQARDLTHLDGIILAHPGARSSSFGGRAMMALSIEDGSIVWQGGVESGSATIGDISSGGSESDIIFQDNYAFRVDGNFYTSTRDADMTRDRLMVSASGLGGEPRWVIRPETVMEAAGVDELEDLGLFTFASLQFGPIDQEGTLYVTNNQNATTGILAIDNSGGLAE